MNQPHESWHISKKRLDDIETFLSNCEGTVYPSKENRYRALKMSPKDVKVVILGQDPYHDGSATGLAFDNRINGVKVSPSLKNILIEMDSLYDVNAINVSYAFNISWLDHLPQQGVLLLNTSLSVKAKSPGSHIKYWQAFTGEVLQKLNAQDDIVYLAWGKFAQDIIDEHITNPTARIIKTSHPSPFSAHKSTKNAPAFIGSNCFKLANEFLESKGKEPIRW
jgi:uracil-DNA glycosylase